MPPTLQSASNPWNSPLRPVAAMVTITATVPQDIADLFIDCLKDEPEALRPCALAGALPSSATLQTSLRPKSTI
ncbi:uncharacterized protein ARMOST_04890 [Armillaria ostoyae]|uniref:Uncharacterized protein n=1 Tax=Armillaria ostoyae TaxID=47428 RepID=A0A284QYM5_ARMOS|nr:uncharacterized protein ARMOST_04890 [Armillaria ostoyae]